MKKDNLIDKIILLVKLLGLVRFSVDESTGSINRNITSIVEDRIRLITFIWSCTKFLVPKTNGLLLSYKSKRAIILIMGS